MKNKNNGIFFIIIFMFIFMLINPVNVYADTNTSYDQCVSECSKVSQDQKDKCLKTCDKNKMSDCDSILGSINDEESVAWLINLVFTYLKFLGPILVLVLSTVDYIKAIVYSDDDNMRKTQKKLITRLLLIGILFFLPDLVTLLLEVFGIVSSATCGIG